MRNFTVLAERSRVGLSLGVRRLVTALDGQIHLPAIERVRDVMVCGSGCWKAK